MTPLRCIIVEDEPLAVELLQEYIGEVPALTLTHVCTNAFEALDVVRNHPVDVIFMDVQMPRMNGMDFLKTLQKPPKVIVISAHQEYAVEGFDLRVTDFLLKPVELSRFNQAVNKLFQVPGSVAKPAPPPPPVRPFYFFTVNKRAVKIYLDEILFFESLKDSVAINTLTTVYKTHYQLGELESLLPPDNFLRIHRSFLVAVDKIASFSAMEVEINGRALPIGRSHKGNVEGRLGRG